jgi:phenylacetate-CoA ligase
VFKYIYGQILEKTVFPVGDLIEGGGFMQWLRQYRNEQWLHASQLREIQKDRLSEILDYARKKVPFYKNLPKRLEDPFEDIKQFPILDKSKINKNLDQLLTVPKEKLVAVSSSGSSGVQGTVYMDKSAQASQRAMQMLWFEWSGFQMGDTVLQTGMTLDRGLIKGAKDFLLKTMYIPAFNLDPALLKNILAEIEKKPRKYLFGYASSLNVLAQTALDLKVSNIKFEYAVSWGDKLFPQYRAKIKQAFGCETLDTYGCTEGAMIASQCRYGRYHLSINQCFVEVVDDNFQPARAGELGNVVATRLDNFAMPLIRYKLGDLIEMEPENPENCPCGRKSPHLRRVIGRDTDIVLTRSGKHMIVHFFTAIFEFVPEIKQFKVVQRNLDEIEIHYIPGPGFSLETLTKIENKIHTHLQEKFSIRWKETSEILPTKSGKPQIIQSFLKGNPSPKNT